MSTEFKVNDWIRVINPARGTYLKTGFVREVLGIDIQAIRVDITGDTYYIYSPEDLEKFYE